MRIGQFSRAVGLAPSALRYYERIGLLPKAARRGGKRWYDQSMLARARMLKAARHAGLRIADLQQLAQNANDPMSRSAVLEARVAAMDRQLQRLAATREISAAAAECGCNDVAACPMSKEAAKEAARTRIEI